MQKRRKGDPGSIGSACGSWTPALKVKASKAWKIHTPKREWFGPVTVRKVGA